MADGVIATDKGVVLELEFQELTSVTTSQSQVEFLSSVMLMVVVEGGYRHELCPDDCPGRRIWYPR